MQTNEQRVVVIERMRRALADDGEPVDPVQVREAARMTMAAAAEEAGDLPSDRVDHLLVALARLLYNIADRIEAERHRGAAPRNPKE